MSKACGYFLLMAAGLLSCPVSCTRQEYAPSGEADVPITLHESPGGTRTILSGPDLPDSYTIYASAYFTNLTEGGYGCGYFVAKPFRKNGGLWEATPTAYWPLGGKLDFLFAAFEYTPADIGSRAVWSEGNCTKGMEVDIPDDYCPGSEILFGATLDRKPEDGSVPIRFKHAQSWLQFIIRSDVADILRIDRIVIENVYAGGTLRVSNDIYLDAEWSFRGHHRSSRTIPGSEGVTVTTGTPPVCNILLPEQEACDISLHYSVRPSAEEGWDAAESSVFHYRAAAYPWYSGEKNIYEISFDFTELTLTSTVRSWDDEPVDIDIN